ncbi:MAG: rhomboid family intramembrane serine protease [Turicibacter sp.]|nr:rhomboid family intramembrane serine protease [Turicibacter sp.]
MRLKVHYNAPVILTYAILSFAVLVMGWLTDGVFTREFFVLHPGNFYDPFSYLRLVTYIFGHADFNHFFGNFSLILLVGPLIEEKYGSRQLVMMILTTALVSGGLHLLFFTSGVLGASGIAFMLILLTPFTNVRSGRLPLTFILIFLIYIGQEVALSMTVHDNISRFLHVLGGILGALMGYAFNRKQ